MKCVCIGRPYTVFGYKGKQVRDNIHSADVIGAFLQFWDAPRPGGQVYNLGGGRFSNCSMLEAIEQCEAIAGRRLQWKYSDVNRIGDHIWYVSDLRRFQADFPGWRQQYDLDALLRDIHASNAERWDRERAEHLPRP
jgi:CDP-paratose 2-epimerase